MVSDPARCSVRVLLPLMPPAMSATTRCWPALTEFAAGSVQVRAAVRLAEVMTDRSVAAIV